MIDDVGGEHRFLVHGVRREIGREPVQVDRSLDCMRDVVGELRQHRGHDTGQDVAAAAFGESGITRRIHSDASVGMRDQRAPALQHQCDVVLAREPARDADAVGLDVLDRDAE